MRGALFHAEVPTVKIFVEQFVSSKIKSQTAANDNLIRFQYRKFIYCFACTTRADDAVHCRYVCAFVHGPDAKLIRLSQTFALNKFPILWYAMYSRLPEASE